MTTAKITCESNDLFRAINLVKHAVGDEPARPILTTVLFEGDESGFRLVAADNYRIAIASVEIEGTASEWGRVALVLTDLVPLLPVLKAGRGKVDLTSTDTAVTLTGDKWTASLRPMHGTWPNYAAVMPDLSGRAMVALNAKYLTEAAKASQVSETGIGVLHIGGPNDAIHISVESAGYREILMPVKVV